MKTSSHLNLYGKTITSRLLLGTAQYPSPASLEQAIHLSGTEIATVSLRRETIGQTKGGKFLEFLRQLKLNILPNTAGCFSVKEAVITAHLARDIFKTNWIKLEIIGHHDTLQPDSFALCEAAKILTDEGFEVFPYMIDDLIVAEKLVLNGCKVLMPWCAPIGTARGPQDIDRLKMLRAYFPDIPLIIDAGIGRPSHAAKIMELGYDAVLLNTAVAQAENPPLMAKAFALAIESGRLGYQAKFIEPRSFAVPSTPVIGKGLFHDE